jgi:hypothetical protein
MVHSLGGIACFDMLALPDPPEVARLVTAGSQSPLLYELGALASLKPPQGLRRDLADAILAVKPVIEREILPAYLAKRRWYAQTDQKLKSVRIALLTRVLSQEGLLLEIENRNNRRQSPAAPAGPVTPGDGAAEGKKDRGCGPVLTRSPDTVRQAKLARSNG